MADEKNEPASSEDMLKEVSEWLTEESPEVEEGTEAPEAAEEQATAEDPAPVPAAEASPFDPVPSRPSHAAATGAAMASAAAAAEYTRPQPARGILFGVLAAVAAAVVWGLVGAYLELQVWIIAVGAGFLIGRAIAWGAGRVDNSLKVAAFALTLGAVVLGEILRVTFGLNREFGFFDLAFAAEFWFETIGDSMEDFLFAMAGGLIGAFLAARTAGQPATPRPKGGPGQPG